MRDIFDGRPEIQIRLCSNGWLVYASEPAYDRVTSVEAFTFNTAEELGEFIKKSAKTYEGLRPKEPKNTV